MATKCFCDKCWEEIPRDYRFRVSFDYFGDKPEYQNDSLVSYDICPKCFHDLQMFIEKNWKI